MPLLDPWGGGLRVRPDPFDAYFVSRNAAILAELDGDATVR
jgi:hypothetical protein